MATKEVETGLVWRVKCHACTANMSTKGIKSVTLAEEFITKHSEETGHTLFDMDVLAHSICVEVIEGELCGKN